MSLNGKKLKGYYKKYQEERKEREAKRPKSKIRFAKSLGLARVRGHGARRGIASTVGIKRNGSHKRERYYPQRRRGYYYPPRRKVRRIKRRSRPRESEYDNGFSNWGGMGFGFENF